MKKIYLLLLTVLFAAVTSNAQLTGTLNIPGAYPNLAAAITDLNTQGVGAGGVTLNLLAGNPETAPAGGYAITATGTLANQITIQGNGNTVTASAALVAGDLNDAIFKLIGADYVTISGFTGQENAANTITAAATNNMTEWGVALLYATNTDGAQNNTIQNNTISLNRAYSNTFGIYSNVRHSATAVTTIADITLASGSNFGNRIYNNAINNVDFGIIFVGSNAAAAMDSGNDIGGASLATGNTITNWGGLVSGAASLYAGMTSSAPGILMNHQINENVSFNTLTSATDITTLTTTGIIGIFKGYFAGQPSGTITANYNNNTVTLSNAATTGQMTGIGLQGLASLSTATYNCNNNNILNCAITGASATSAALVGMLHSSGPGVFNENGNTFRGFTTTAATGPVIGIQHQTNAVSTTLNINNNNLGDGTAGLVTFMNATAQSGAVTGLSVTSTGASATCALSISNNDFRGIVHTALGSGSNTYIVNGAATLSQSISSNTLTNLNLNTTGSVTFISNSITLPANGVKNVNNNSIVTGFNKAGSGGTVTMCTDGASDPATATNSVTNNSFSNITLTGATTFNGIVNTNGGFPTKIVTGNTVSNITGGTNTVTGMSINFDAGTTTVASNTISNITNGGAIVGILFGTSGTNGTTNASLNTVHSLTGTGTGAVTGITLGGANTTTRNLFKNKIYNLENSSTSTGTVNGILISSGALAHNVYNNLIGDLRAPSANNATDAVRGINITSLTTLSNINLSYNTIYINAASTGTNFGASGVFHTTSTTATTASLTMRNNIIYNNSFANGTGFVSAFRRSSGAANTLNNYNAASNNNLFFAGTPGANRLIYYDGTSSAQTLAAYKAGVFTAGTIAPRDAASVTELSTPFLSTSGANANFLHINTTIPTAVESAGTNIAAITDDYDGDARNATTPDIGADEFTGVTVSACAGVPVAGSISGSNSICEGQFALLNLSGYSSNSGISLQWRSSAVTGGPYTDIIGEVGTSYNTGVIPTGTTVYYVVTVTCANGGGNATTAEFAVTSNAAPTVSVNPPAPTICSGLAGVALTASGAITYTWSPATGLSATTGATVTANPASTTTYTVTGTNAAGCTNAANVTVTVNNSPVVTTSATPGAICSGANSQLNSTVNLGGPADSYSLSALTGQTYTTLTGGGITVINTNAQLTPGMGGGTQDDGGVVITLPFSFTYMGNTFTEMSMCTNGWVGAGNWGTIDAVTMRTAANFFTSTIPNNTIAAWFKDMGANFPLGTGSMRHGLIGTDVYAFQWDNANGSSFGDNATNLISFQVNIYGPASATPGRIEAIYGPTVGAITFAASEGIEDATGGANHFMNALNGSGTSTVTSTAWPGNGNGYRFDPIVATYLWSPATFLSSTTSPNPIATAVTATTTYTLTVTSSNGCSTASNVTVTVLSPVVSAVLVQPTTCVTTDGSITLTVSGGTGGVGPYSYAWVGPGVNPTSQNQANLGVGSYTVTVTDIPSGCTNVLTYGLPGPGGCNICPSIPTLTTSPSPAACLNENVSLTASGLTDMGVTYGITFKQSTVALADPYIGGTVIATVPNGGLTSGGTVASTVTSFAATGNYFIYAILSPVPPDPTCRPFASSNLSVNPLPTVNPVADQTLCHNSSTTAVTFSGSIPGTVYNWTNNTTSIGLAANGAGNIPSFVAVNTTTAAVVATITVTPVYTGGGTTCTGTPTSFTITVNPNPSLIVVADPGTTICEGDPTLLTVYNSAGFANMALTQSSSTAITGGNSVSCNAGGLHTDNSYWRAYNLAPLGLPSALTVNTVTFGIELAAGGAQPVTVNIYSQNAGPAFPGGTRTLLGSQAASVPNQTLSLFTVTFATPVVVPSNAVMIVELFTPSGQATGRSFFVGSNAAAQTGPSYLSAVACGVATPTDVAVIGFPNMHIILNVAGTVGSTGSIATGTFLWSPAAGLSSTTSNPVAAAPMNTTTYTVRRTTVPGGCVDSAQITITVNKRPTVTTHPVASVNCATSTATFTVVGTGTALTYQWQQSVTGPGGPWVNVPTTAPYFGGTTATLTINPVSVIMNGYAFRCVLSGTCAAIGTNNISNPAVLTVNPLPLVAITPAVSCGGVAGISGTQLTVGSAPPPVPGSVTVSSGTISVPIPDATGDPAISTLTIAGIPANATIGEVKINMNINHTWVGDVDVNIKAPNAAILNLVGGLDGGTGGNSTDNFTNTTFSSLGGAGISGAAAPRTGTFAAEARAGYGPTGYIQTVNNWPALYPTAPVANGVWTIAMGDFVGGDTGTLTSWSMTIDYTTPGGGTGPVLSYVWSPLAGLYTNATATVPYTGTNTPTVYAAPTALTVYTVTATDVATGCFSRATAIVNYTPPAPTVVPAAVTMCLGDPAVKLKSSSSQSFSQTFSSGTVNVVIPDGPTIPPVPTTYPASSSNITVAGVPAGATITGVRARFNITHVYVGDLVMALKAPNGKILNLDAMLNRTNGSGANFTNTVIGSAGTTLLSAGAAPWTGTFRADLAGATFTAFGFTWPGGPVGYVPNAAAYNELYNTGPVNGVWSIGIYDAGAPDGGTLNNWSLDIDYVVGVPATPAVWTPIAGLFSDAAASTAYVAGTAVDSVWARPTPNGVYNYQATVQSMPVQSTFTNPANIVINASGNGTPYPAVIAVSGLPTSAVAVDSVRLTGVSHTWGNDIDILLQSPTGQNVVLMSDIGGTVAVPNATYTFRDGAPAMNANAANPTGTYSPTNNGAADNWPAPGPGAITQAAPALSMFGTANVNGNWNLFVFDDVGGDAGNISGGFTIYFNVSVPACTSPARTVVVTVNLPTTLNANLPASQTVCTDKVATFTAAVATGTGPHSYRWEVSTNSGNPPWTTVANGGVYSGATAATLTITAPPVSMNGYFYRCVVTGAAPCASVTSIIARLGVNPLPTIVISASPYTSLFPGLTTTLSSTVSPAAASSYTWLRNGAAVPNAITGTLGVNVDGLGNYQLRVTDVNGCTNVSNIVTIKDSVSGKCFLYPNPTNGIFQVRYYSVANNVLPRSLTVYDAKGDRVLTRMYTIGRPYDRMDVDMRAFGKGLYWVEIGDRNGNRLAMCRVAIQ